MTTTTDPTPSSPSPGASSAELSEIWRAIGRLEGTANAVLEGQRRQDDKIDTGFREMNRRIDRLFYLILGIGGALLVSVYATQFIGS